MERERSGAVTKVPVSAILDFLADRVEFADVRQTREITGVAAIAPGRPGCLSFSGERDPSKAEQILRSASDLILLRLGVLDAVMSVPGGLIAVEEPRREYARVVQEFFAHDLPASVAPTAVVDQNAVVGSDTEVGPGAHLAADVVIGDNCRIGANCVILPGTVIGSNTTIGPNCSIGYAGFGYVREADGTPIHVPHLGGVQIGSNVEIGANTCIDRGTIDDTVIEDDVKIDNLVHIAHNCVVHAGAFVIATAIVCGGVRIGPRAWIAPNASIREQLMIGADAVVGLGATVLKDVPDSATVVGSPAKEVGR